MAGLIFIGLNIADAFLTKTGLALGASEINPLVATFGGNILIKGLIAAVVIFALCYFGKKKLLWHLNFAMLGVVLWNLAACTIMGIIY